MIKLKQLLIESKLKSLDFIKSAVPIRHVKWVDEYRVNGILIDRGYLFVDKKGNEFLMNYNESMGQIQITTIYANPKGTGFGSKMVKALMNYADKTSQKIKVNSVRNDIFFKKMGFEPLQQGWFYFPK